MSGASAKTRASPGRPSRMRLASTRASSAPSRPARRTHPFQHACAWPWPLGPTCRFASTRRPVRPSGTGTNPQSQRPSSPRSMRGGNRTRSSRFGTRFVAGSTWECTTRAQASSLPPKSSLSCGDSSSCSAGRTPRPRPSHRGRVGSASKEGDRSRDCSSFARPRRTGRSRRSIGASSDLPIQQMVGTPSRHWSGGARGRDPRCSGHRVLAAWKDRIGWWLAPDLEGSAGLPAHVFWLPCATLDCRPTT
ncbi:MAG: hypothetical protein QOI92_2459, partial [Chloroflexota bacterium]|nr:hypothetical protein [Chloroflexota bacterium]